MNFEAYTLKRDSCVNLKLFIAANTTTEREVEITTTPRKSERLAGRDLNKSSSLLNNRVEE